MKPRLFRLSDIFPIWLFALLAFVIPVVAWLSHTHYETWGEKVPTQGWVVTLLFSLSSLGIVFEFYRRRYQFISQWRYTTKHGIICYYEPGAFPYLLIDVEKATDAILDRWSKYQFESPYPKQPYSKLIEQFKGVVCFFTKSGVFVHSQLGYGDRKVYGVSGWNWMKIGQGDKPVKGTAYMHECSHLYVNFVYEDMVEENRAHELFKGVGI